MRQEHRCQEAILSPAPPPRDEQELFARAVALSGYPLGHVAHRFGVDLPGRPQRAKGWIGRLLETALGATAGQAAEPDFPHLGVELKTIPVRADGRPMESTWLTKVPLRDAADQTWEVSSARRKLARVLWMPVEGDTGIPLGERRLGSPLLWSPSDDEEAMLRADYRDLMDLVVLGESEAITASLGECLQIRPKGADAAERVIGVGPDGCLVPVPPRGFYLRASFTAAILRRGFGL